MNEENNFTPVEPVTPVTPTEPTPTPMPTPVVEQPVQPEMQTPIEPQIDPSFGTNVSIPVQQVPAPTKKKNPLPIILIVLAILAGGGFAVWKFVLPNITGDKNETTTTAEILAGTIELTDKDTISKLDKGIKFYSTAGIEAILDDKYKSENYKLTDNSKKAYLAIYNTNHVTDQNVINEFNASTHTFSDQIKAFYSEIDQVAASVTSDEENILDAYLYNSKDVAAVYKEMFNEDFDAKAFGDIGKHADGVWSCPSFPYDSTTDKYVSLQACGGESGIIDLSYTYKYEKEINGEEEKYYAYVAVGYIKFTIVGEDDKAFLYYSYMDENKKDDKSEDNNIVSFKIDSSNYEKFDKFMYVFTKDNATGNIYVDHIEHVK